jgi:hypothetical protein
MKTLFMPQLIVVTVLLTAGTLCADVTPTNPGTPVLRVYVGIPAKQGGDAMTFDKDHPVLVITSVRDAVIGQDHKSVALQLNANDTRTLAALTRQYAKGFLLFVAEGRVLEARHVTKPINDGILAFKYPDHATAADYLRKRFRLGESR